MVGTFRTVVGLCAALWLALLAGAPGALAQEQAEAVARGVESIRVPRTEESAALARATTERINAFHYSLLRTEVPGFVASFRAERDGRPAGTLRISWNREADWMTAVLKGELDEETRAAGAVLARRAVRLALAADWSYDGCHAIEQGTRVVVDPTGSEASTSDGEKLHLDFVERDLLSWSHFIRNGDDSVLEEACRYQAVGDRGYLASFLREERKPDRPPHKTDYAIKYLRRDGQVFVKRVTAKETIADAETLWRFEFVEVEFRAVGDVAAGPEERLAGELIARIQEKHYSLWYVGLDGFVARYDLTWEGRSLGEVTLRWSNRDGSLKARMVSGIPKDLAESFAKNNTLTLEEWVEQAAVDWLWDAALLGFGSMGANYSSRAKRVGDQHILLQKDTSESETVASMITILDTNERVISVERRYRAGGSEVRAFDQRPADGKHLKKRVVWTVKDPEGFTWSRSVSYVYVRQDGFLFPKRIHSEIRGDTSARNSSGDTTLELRKVDFRKAAAPGQEGAPQ